MHLLLLTLFIWLLRYYTLIQHHNQMTRYQWLPWPTCCSSQSATMTQLQWPMGCHIHNRNPLSTSFASLLKPFLFWLSNNWFTTLLPQTVHRPKVKIESGQLRRDEFQCRIPRREQPHVRAHHSHKALETLRRLEELQRCKRQKHVRCILQCVNDHRPIVQDSRHDPTWPVPPRSISDRPATYPLLLVDPFASPQLSTNDDADVVEIAGEVREDGCEPEPGGCTSESLCIRTDEVELCGPDEMINEKVTGHAEFWEDEAATDEIVVDLEARDRALEHVEALSDSDRWKEPGRRP